MRQGDDTGGRGRVPYTQLAGPLIDQIPAAIALFDAELRCVMVNARWLTQFPSPAADPVGRDCNDLFEDGCMLLRGYLERGLAGETFSSEAASPDSSDGGQYWFRSHVAPWRDTRGKVRGAMLVWRECHRRNGTDPANKAAAGGIVAVCRQRRRGLPCACSTSRAV